MVFSSTSEVYGRSQRIPFEEDSERLLGSTRVDRWCSANSKAAGEHFCFAFHRLGLPVVVPRYVTIYGPRMDQMDMGRVIPIFMGQLLRDEPLTVIGDGLQTRSFTYVDDAIRATLAAGLEERAVGEVINIGADEEVNLRCLAELMIQFSGVTLDDQLRESGIGLWTTLRRHPQEGAISTEDAGDPRRRPEGVFTRWASTND